MAQYKVRAPEGTTMANVTQLLWENGIRWDTEKLVEQPVAKFLTRVNTKVYGLVIDNGYASFTRFPDTFYENPFPQREWEDVFQDTHRGFKDE